MKLKPRMQERLEQATYKFVREAHWSDAVTEALYFLLALVVVSPLLPTLVEEGLLNLISAQALGIFFAVLAVCHAVTMTFTVAALVVRKRVIG